MSALSAVVCNFNVTIFYVIWKCEVNSQKVITAFKVCSPSDTFWGTGMLTTMPESAYM